MKKIIIAFICLVIVVGGVGFVLSSRKVEIAEVIVKQVEAKKLANEEIIWNLLEARGLTLLEKIDVMMVLRCESKFSQWAIGVNSNGSIDTGIVQWNSQAHPEVSRECSFNVECAINKMVDLYKKDGNLNQWVCSKVLK